MSQQSDSATTHPALAFCADDLLRRPAIMAAARVGVARYQEGVAQGTIGPIADRLPTDPNNDLDWTETSLTEEREGLPPLTPEQTVAAIAAHHDVHCPGGQLVLEGGRLRIQPPFNDPAAARRLRALEPALRELREPLLALLTGAAGSAPSGQPGDPPAIVCPLRGAAWHVPMDEVLRLAADPAWCDRGGARARPDVPAAARCPYKP